MKVNQIYSLIIPLFLIGNTSFFERKSGLEGNYKIDLVLVENDTLYQTNQILITSKYYSSREGNWEKNKDDLEFLNRCIRYTYLTFKNAKLTFTRKTFDQTAINPCFDHLKLDGIRGGIFYQLEDSIYLYNHQNDPFMNLHWDALNETLHYFNQEQKFKIIYKKEKK